MHNKAEVITVLFRREKKRFVPGMLIGLAVGAGAVSVAFCASDRKKMDCIIKAVNRMKTAAVQYMKR